MVPCARSAYEERLRMFVRKKTKARGSDFYQLVQSGRVDGVPRQKVILHLGSHATVDDALKEWPRTIARLRRGAYEAEAETLKAKLDRLKKLRAAGEV